MSEAWGLVTKRVGLWVGVSLVYIAVGAIVAVLEIQLEDALFGGAQADDLSPVSVLFAMIKELHISTIMTILDSFVFAFFFGGSYLVALKQLRGEPVAFGDLFKAGHLYWALVGVTILINVSVWIGLLLCCIPGLVIGGLLMFCYPLVVDQQKGFGEAVQQSVNKLSRHWLAATCFFLVVGLCIAAGILLCGIGLLFTLPLCFIAPTVLYRDFFPERFQPPVPTGPSPYPRGP